MQLFTQATADTATVIRGGNKLVLDPVSLVPGDIVHVQSGDRVAADMRVVRLEYMLAVSGQNWGLGGPQWMHFAGADDSHLTAGQVLLDGPNSNSVHKRQDL